VWSDNFSTDQSVLYDIKPAPSNLVVASGVVTPSSATEIFVEKMGLLVRDFVAQCKFTLDSGVYDNNCVVGFVAAYDDVSGVALTGQFQWNDGAGGAGLDIYLSDPAFSAPAQLTGVARPIAGQNRWLRMVKAGDSVTLLLYAADPDVEPVAPTSSVTANIGGTVAHQAMVGALSEPKRMRLAFAGPTANPTNFHLDDLKVWTI